MISGIKWKKIGKNLLFSEGMNNFELNCIFDLTTAENVHQGSAIRRLNSLLQHISSTQRLVAYTDNGNSKLKYNIQYSPDSLLNSGPQ